MILLLKDKEMSLRDFEMFKINMKKALIMTDFHGFTCYYKGNKGYFKINEKHRRVLEQHLYIID